MEDVRVKQEAAPTEKAEPTTPSNIQGSLKQPTGGILTPKQAVPSQTPSTAGIAVPQPVVKPEQIKQEVAELSQSSTRSALASEEMIELHRKLIEKEKAVVDLEEKLATLKQKRSEDKNKLKDFEKLKMQNEQVYIATHYYLDLLKMNLVGSNAQITNKTCLRLTN